MTRLPAVPHRLRAAILAREKAREMTDDRTGIVVCDACPVLCRIRPGRTGACDRYGNVGGASW